MTRWQTSIPHRLKTLSPLEKDMIEHDVVVSIATCVVVVNFLNTFNIEYFVACDRQIAWQYISSIKSVKIICPTGSSPSLSLQS